MGHTGLAPVPIRSEWLLLGLHPVLPELVDLRGEDGLRGRGGVHAVGLDGDHDPAVVLQEEASTSRRNKKKGARVSFVLFV